MLFRSSALHVLQVVAFLPQGVDHNKLSHLFPSIPNIQQIADATRKMSLTHRNNDFITILTPIRLYLLHADHSEFPLIKDVQSFYFEDLEPGDEGFGRGTWIVSEDDNVESLIARSDNYPDACQACSDFLHVLYWHKRRMTTLGDKIRGLPESDGKSAQLKWCCLRKVGRTAGDIGRLVDATEINTAARSLALAHNDPVLATNSLRDLAAISRRSGKYSDAVSQ